MRAFIPVRSTTDLVLMSARASGTPGNDKGKYIADFEIVLCGRFVGGLLGVECGQVATRQTQIRVYIVAAHWHTCIVDRPTSPT
jgi:hypothetical protein